MKNKMLTYFKDGYISQNLRILNVFFKTGSLSKIKIGTSFNSMLTLFGLFRFVSLYNLPFTFPKIFVQIGCYSSRIPYQLFAFQFFLHPDMSNTRCLRSNQSFMHIQSQAGCDFCH